jgi:hypothetical protein
MTLDISQANITLLGLNKLFNSYIRKTSNPLKAFIYHRLGIFILITFLLLLLNSLIRIIITLFFL